MLKRIPKSDISIRPFKAYKEWSFSSGSTDVSLLYASDTQSGDNSFNNDAGATSYTSLYGQLRAQFYNGDEYNPFTRTGHKSSLYIPESKAKERYLSGSAKVISIPLKYVGEGIKKSSLQLIDDSTLGTYVDDGVGNLYDVRDQVFVSLIDVESGSFPTQLTFRFEDTTENSYTISLDNDYFIDIQSQSLEFTYKGIAYRDNTSIRIDKFDTDTGQMIVDNFPFLPVDANGIKIGNVFYQQGLVTLNREVDTHLLTDWNLTYKSTQTIYEHEYLLISNQDEFNISQNPTAITQVGGKYSMFVDSNGVSRKVYTEQPTKYIRKKSIMDDGQVLDFRYSSSVSSSTHFAGFEHYDLSSSIDTTGSFLAPFITTIGLYDDNCDLVAVAKLPQPIKSEPDIPINFIVRFDT